MATMDDRFLKRAHRAYELGRARRSALVALPALLFVGASAALGGGSNALLLGAAMFVVAAAAAQRGGSLGRGVGPGFVYGILPFATASAAQGFGHACVGDVCMSYCLPACAVAGVITGVLVSRSALDRHGGLGAWASASSIVVLAGAMGCRCIGLGSVLGLAIGLLTATAPMLPALVRESRG
ncbi:MAG: hypothetical protein U0230_13025 [Polyangiales bacterium]